MPKLKKITGNYTTVPNSWVNDETLSLKAKGLLLIIQSLSEGWNFSIAGLATKSKDSIDATRTAIEELKKTGYLIWKKIHNKCGKFEVIVELHEEKATMENPTWENPTWQNPIWENRPQINNNITNTNETNNNGTNITTNVVIGETPKTYGNEEINKAFEFWESSFGIPQKNSQSNRRAAYNLLRSKGDDWLKNSIKILLVAKRTKFVRKEVAGIANFSDLQKNWEYLWQWGRDYAEKNSKTIVTDRI